MYTSNFIIFYVLLTNKIKNLVYNFFFFFYYIFIYGPRSILFNIFAPLLSSSSSSFLVQGQPTKIKCMINPVVDPLVPPDPV